MTIGTATRHAGARAETIRFYERCGLIARPAILANNSFRVYLAATVRRIRFIRQPQKLGFLLPEIDELLSLRAIPSTGHTDSPRRGQTELNKSTGSWRGSRRP